MLYNNSYKTYIILLSIPIIAFLLGGIIGFKFVFFIVSGISFSVATILNSSSNFYEIYLEIIDINLFNKYMLVSKKKQRYLKNLSISINLILSFIFLINALSIPWNCTFKNVFINFIFTILVIFTAVSFVGVFIWIKNKEL